MSSKKIKYKYGSDCRNLSPWRMKGTLSMKWETWEVTTKKWNFNFIFVLKFQIHLLCCSFILVSLIYGQIWEHLDISDWQYLHFISFKMLLYLRPKISWSFLLVNTIPPYIQHFSLECKTPESSIFI